MNETTCFNWDIVFVVSECLLSCINITTVKQKVQYVSVLRFDISRQSAEAVCEKSTPSDSIHLQ